jgi:arylsulfatase A-like enzyme
MRAYASAAVPGPARLTSTQGVALGAAVGAFACLLEVLLRGAPFAASGFMLAALLGAAAGGTFGAMTAALRRPGVAAGVGLVPAWILGFDAIHWLVFRVFELQVLAAPELWLARIRVALWLVVLLVAMLAAGLARSWAQRAGRGRRQQWIAALALPVPVFVLALPLFELEPLVAMVGVALALLMLPFVLLLGGVLPRVLALLIALGSLAVMLVLPARYVEQQALFGCWFALALFAAARVDAPRWLARRLSRRLPAWVLSLALLAAAAASHVVVKAAPMAWRAREGQGSLSALMHLGHWATDFDGDGHGAWLGHDDCAPFSAEIHPEQHEVPRNGVDDNCLAGDADVDPERFLRERERLNPLPPAWRGDVVLYTIDTLRYDTALATAPFAELAAQGTTFTRAYSSSTFTSQALLAILAAKLPTAMPLHWENRFNGYPARPPGGPALQLRRAGYDTAIAGGSDSVRQSARGNEYFQPEVFGHGFRHAHLVPRYSPASAVVPAARAAWRALDPKGPRFLWVHDLSVHESDLSDDGYRQAVQDAAEAFAEIRAFIGDEAMWVVTSDHGEELREHGGIGHAKTLYEEVLHVPLVVWVPGRAPALVERLSPLRSVMPSLVATVAPELAPPGLGPYLCLGQADCRDLPVVAALELSDRHRHVLVIGRHKLVRDLRRNLVRAFDLHNDPHERHPLDPLPPGLEAELVAWEEAAFGHLDDRLAWPYLGSAQRR